MSETQELMLKILQDLAKTVESLSRRVEELEQRPVFYSTNTVSPRVKSSADEKEIIELSLKPQLEKAIDAIIRDSRVRPIGTVR